MKKEKLPINSIRANIVPASLNKEERTFDVTFATEAPVLRYDWYNERSYNEVLSCKQENMRIERFLNGNVPMLNSHNRYGGVESILGNCSNLRYENGTCVCTVTLSKRESITEIWNDIVDGIIRSISVGYSVYKYEKSQDQPKEGERGSYTYRAIDWEPTEVSLVSVPADMNAGIRSKEDQKFNEVEIVSLNLNRKMEEPLITPVVPQVDVAKERSEAIAAERKRTSEIMSLCKQAKLSDEFARGLIDKGDTIEVAQRAIITEFAKGEEGGETRGQNANVTVKVDVAEKVRSGVELALSHRIGVEKELKSEARDYRGMSLIRLAEEVLTSEGVKTRGMSQRELSQMALGMTRTMSTSDFPNILGSLINKSLRAQYEYAPRTFAPITRKTTASDFKTKNVLQLSGLVGAFEEVLEGGEYKAGKMTEYKEAYAVKKYGKKIVVTWESLINDDMNAFTRIPGAIAQAAAQKQSDIVWGIITANAAMADSVAIFHADHANLANPATAITVAGLGLARKAIRNQKSLEGTYINLQPKFLVVGPDKELEAQQFLSSNYVAAQNSAVNPFAGALTLIVEPRLTGNQWYMISDPNMVDTIEYAFLEGEGELFTEQRNGFEVDGLEVKARMVFGAKAIDYRGMYKNAGA